jgi:hypothetical protein
LRFISQGVIIFTMTRQATFLEDTIRYALQVKLFDPVDWLAYFAWVGLMMGLFWSVFGFLWVGHSHGVTYPVYVWNLPVGIAIFVVAISFDTIGHRTTYARALDRGERLVHHITIFAGITSCVLLCAAYTYRDCLRLPALTLTALSVFYSVIDEAMHWHRYYEGNSDRVEMWSHFFIFVGHLLFVLTWVQWFEQGYPGVAETVRYLPKLF